MERGEPLLFGLQVHIEHFRGSSHLITFEDPPRIAFSFLDYDPVVIHPQGGQSVVLDEFGTQGTAPRLVWEFQRGKSCLLSSTARGMRRSLWHVPLVVMLVGEMKQTSSKQARLYATSCLSLASFVPPRREEDEGSVSTWGHYRGTVDIFTCKNQIGGCIDLSISLVSYGPRHTHPYADHLIHHKSQDAASPARSQRKQEPQEAPLRKQCGDDEEVPPHTVAARCSPNPMARRLPQSPPQAVHDGFVGSSGSCGGDGDGGPYLVGREPFRVWDADLLQGGYRRSDATWTGSNRCRMVAAEDGEDPPPLFFYQHDHGGHHQHHHQGPEVGAAVPPDWGDLSPLRTNSLSPVRRMNQQPPSCMVPWREPGVAKVALGRSKSASPLRTRLGQRGSNSRGRHYQHKRTTRMERG